MSDKIDHDGLYRTAESQAGYFTTQQVIDAGMDRSTLEDAADLEIGADVEVRRARVEAVGEWPAPIGALAGRMPSIEIEDVKAARREALHDRPISLSHEYWRMRGAGDVAMTTDEILALTRA